MRAVLRLIQWLLIIAISLLAFYTISSYFSFSSNYQSFVVQSGSMEPSIMTGDIIVVRQQGKYYPNETITFFNNSDQIVTHRIIEIENDLYQTKGDANRAGDDDKIAKDQVIGKVVLVIPRLGFLVAIAQSRLGIFLLLIIPVCILIIDQLLKKDDQKKP
jgi:signal peptidase I